MRRTGSRTILPPPSSASTAWAPKGTPTRSMRSRRRVSPSCCRSASQPPSCRDSSKRSAVRRSSRLSRLPAVCLPRTLSQGWPAWIRLAFGNVDLAAALGVDPSSQTALWHARSHLVMACAANGVAGPVDGVTTALDDPDRLAEDVRHAVDLGFTAKLCIHPRQVAGVHAGLQPASADVDWAERVVAAAGGGAVAVDGEMVDGPVILRARTILARAGSPSFD